ncbi:MAG: hypothetical protein ACFFB5_10440 [Promethearchaeota archaeon]
MRSGNRFKFTLILTILVFTITLSFKSSLFAKSGFFISKSTNNYINTIKSRSDSPVLSTTEDSDLPFEFNPEGSVLSYDDPSHDLITILGRAQPEDADFDFQYFEFGKNDTHLFINVTLRGDPGDFWSKGYHSDLGGVDLHFVYDTGDENDRYPNDTFDIFSRQRFSAARVHMDPEFTWNYSWGLYDPIGYEKGYTWDNEFMYLNETGLINGADDDLPDTILPLFGTDASRYDPRVGKNTTTITYYSPTTRTVYTALPWHFLGLKPGQDVSTYKFNFTAFTCFDFMTADLGGEADDVSSGIFDVIGDDNTVELAGNTSMIHSWLEVDFGNEKITEIINYDYKNPLTGELKIFTPTGEKIYLDIPWDIPKGPNDPWDDYNLAWAANNYSTNLKLFSIQHHASNKTTFRIFVVNDTIEQYVRKGSGTIDYATNPYKRARETIDWSKVSIFITIDLYPGGKVLLPTRNDAAVNPIGAWDRTLEIRSANDNDNYYWIYNDTTEVISNKTFDEAEIYSNQDKFDYDIFGRPLTVAKYLNITLPTEIIRPPEGKLVRFGIFTITKENITSTIEGEPFDLPDVVDVSSGAWAWKASEPKIQETGADPGYDEIIPAGALNFSKNTRMLHSFLEYDFTTNHMEMGIAPISNLISSNSFDIGTVRSLNGLPDDPASVDISGISIGYRFDRHDVAWGVEDPSLEREFSAVIIAIQMDHYINETSTSIAILFDLEDGGDSDVFVHSDMDLSLDMSTFNWDYAFFSTNLFNPKETQIITNWDGSRVFTAIDEMTVLGESIIGNVNIAGSVAYFEIENSLFIHSIKPDRSIKGEMVVLTYPNPTSYNLSLLPPPVYFDLIGNITDNRITEGLTVDLSVPGPVIFKTDIFVISYDSVPMNLTVLDNQTFTIRANITDPDGISTGGLTKPTLSFYTTHGEKGTLKMTKTAGTNETYQAHFPAWLQAYNSTWLTSGWTGATLFFKITAYDVFNHKGGTVSLMSVEIQPSDTKPPEIGQFWVELWVNNKLNNSLKAPFTTNYTITDDDFIRINASATDYYWTDVWSLLDENGTLDLSRQETFADVRRAYGFTSAFISSMKLNLSLNGGQSFVLRDLEFDRRGHVFYGTTGIGDPSAQLGPFFPKTEVHLNIVAEDIFGNSKASDTIILEVQYKIPPVPPDYRSSIVDLGLMWLTPIILVLAVAIALKPDLVLPRRKTG